VYICVYSPLKKQLFDGGIVCLILPQNSSYQFNKKEEEKLNRLLLFLEKSGVGKLIYQECYKDHSKRGRPGKRRAAKVLLSSNLSTL
jgi:hypothetical protein